MNRTTRDNPDTTKSEVKDRYSSDSTRMGHRVGLALYYLLLVYIIGAGILSVVPQIFLSKDSPTLDTTQEKHCAREIYSLKFELLEKAGDLMSNGELEAQRRWFSSWDQRYKALGKSCGSLEPTRIELYKLRDDTEVLLKRFHRRKQTVTAQIDKAYQQVTEATLKTKSKH